MHLHLIPHEMHERQSMHERNRIHPIVLKNEWVNQLPGFLCSSHFIYIEHVSGESPATVVENFACICPGCTKISAYDECLLLKHEPV